MATFSSDRAPTPAPVPGVGRPRRFTPEIEVRLIEDAALVVMRRNAYEDISVGDILEVAGLSTRSFYRHFRSKDDLVLAMYRHNAEAAAERLAARSARPRQPAARLAAWIEEILSFLYDRRKAERMALLGSPGVRRAVGYLDEERDARTLLVAPLVDVLRAGCEDGTFTSVDPVRDAFTVLAIVFDEVEWARRRDPRPAPGDALGHCLRFVMGGLTGP